MAFSHGDNLEFVVGGVESDTHPLYAVLPGPWAPRERDARDEENSAPENLQPFVYTCLG